MLKLPLGLSGSCLALHQFIKVGQLTVNMMVQSAGIDETLTETLVENKAVCVEETEATSKYVVSEDMEVIDDLEEGSEGGSNDSGDFSDADEGTATPSSSGTSKSESGRVLFNNYVIFMCTKHGSYLILYINCMEKDQSLLSYMVPEKSETMAKIRN